MPGIPNLSTLGITKPTTSSAVSPNAPMVSGLLGDVIPRREGEILAANQGMAAARDMDIPSFLDRLKSPAGLAALVSTIAGGAMGGIPGAVGAASGSMGGIANQVAGDQNAQASQIQQLQAARDKAQEDLDKTRTRLATLLGQDPAAFTKVDPTTGQLVPIAPPDVIGYYVTGTAIPLDPTAKIMTERRGKQWEASMKMVSEALQNSTSVEDRRNLVKYGFDLIDSPNVPDSVVEAMTQAFGTPEFETRLAELWMKYFGSTGHTAILHAVQNNLSLADPGVVRLLKYQDPNADLSANLSPEQQVTSLFLQSLKKINLWAKQHPTEDARLLDEAGGDDRLYYGNLGAVALSEDKELKGAFLDKLNLSPNVVSEYYRAYGQVEGQFSLAQTLARMKGLDLGKMTSEEVDRMMANAAVQQVNSARTEVNRNSVTRELQSFDNIVRTRLQPLGLKPAQIDQVILTIRQTALANATGANGTVDQALYESEIQRLAQKAQDDLSVKP